MMALLLMSEGLGVGVDDFGGSMFVFVEDG